MVLPASMAFSLAMLGCAALVRAARSGAGCPTGERPALPHAERCRGTGDDVGGVGAGGAGAGAQSSSACRAGHQALRIAVETRSHFTSLTSWAASIALLADAGRWERALEGYSAGQGVPLLANSRWQAEMAAPWVAAAAVHLSPEAVEGCSTARPGRDFFAVDEEILLEFFGDVGASRPAVIATAG